jgi:hypothetical protein
MMGAESAFEKEAVERTALEVCMVQKAPDAEDSLDSSWTSPSEDEMLQAAITPVIRRPCRPQQLSAVDISRPIASDSPKATFTTFTVELQKSDSDDKLGLDVDKTNGKTLVVAAVREGMAKIYNASVQFDKQIRPGDSIISVNEVSGDSQEMLAAVQSMKLSLVVERPNPQATGKENAEDLSAAKTPLAAPGVGSLRESSEVSPKETKTPLTSKSHIDQWDTADETLLFFDWDDTLCPTTYIWEDSRLKWNEVAPCFADPSIPGHPPDVPSPSKASSHLPAPPTPVGNTGCRSSEVHRIVSASDISSISLSEVSDKTMLELFEEHQSAVIELLRLAVTL